MIIDDDDDDDDDDDVSVNHMLTISLTIVVPCNGHFSNEVQRRVYALRLHGVESPEEAVALRGYRVFVFGTSARY